MLSIAFVINLIFAFSEVYALASIRGKKNLLKYYTYLQNFLGLITSLVFLVYLIIFALGGSVVPPFVKGLRYVTTCGLLSATTMFLCFLGVGKKAPMTKEDFYPIISPRLANVILHYACPLLSLISLVFFERDIVLTSGIWTAIVALPSLIYWIVYIVLTLTKKWIPPYDFKPNRERSKAWEYLPYFLIPISFVAISIGLWALI